MPHRFKLTISISCIEITIFWQEKGKECRKNPWIKLYVFNSSIITRTPSYLSFSIFWSFSLGDQQLFVNIQNNCFCNLVDSYDHSILPKKSLIATNNEWQIHLNYHTSFSTNWCFLVYSHMLRISLSDSIKTRVCARRSFSTTASKKGGKTVVKLTVE